MNAEADDQVLLAASADTAFPAGASWPSKSAIGGPEGEP
jgi:hypothetical protein